MSRTRKWVCSANLKPAAMCGVISHAMVLAASNEDHTKVRNHIGFAFLSALVCFQVDMASQKITTAATLVCENWHLILGWNAWVSKICSRGEVTFAGALGKSVGRWWGSNPRLKTMLHHTWYTACDVFFCSSSSAGNSTMYPVSSVSVDI
jgi:hypothetical protein